MSINYFDNNSVIIYNDGSLSCPDNGTNSERFGAGATIGGATESLAVGAGANLTANESVVVGFNATITAGANSTAIGHNAQGADINVIVGHETQSTASGATLVGEFARNPSANCVAMGWRSLIDANSANSVAVGDHAHININSSESVVVGSNANCSNGGGNVAIGNFATCNSDIAVSIGQFTTANGSGSICIGWEASSQFANSIAMGVRGTATAINQFTMGHISQEFTDAYFGGGVNYPGAPFVSYLTAPITPNFTLHGTNGRFFVALGAPTLPPTLSNTPAGSSLAAGTYNFTYSYRNKDDFGETPLSPSASITIAAGDSITVTPNPTIPGGGGNGQYQDINIYLDNPIGSGSNYQQINSTFGGPVIITSFSYGNNNDGVDTTSYDGDGYPLLLAGGMGDVSGVGGNVEVLTSATPNTLITRMVVNSVAKALSDGNPNDLFQIALPNGSTAGGRIKWVVRVNNTLNDFQSLSGITTFAAVCDGAGGITAPTPVNNTSNDTFAATSGTLTTTWSATTGTNTVNIQVTPTTSLTLPLGAVFDIQYQVENDSTVDITIL